MLLLLIRHAHAGDRDAERWPDDRDRPLTDKGRKTQRKVSARAGQARPRHRPRSSPALAPGRADGRDPGPGARPSRAARFRAPRSPPSRISSVSRTTSATLARTPSWRWWAIRPGSRSWPRCCSPFDGEGWRCDYPKSGVMGIQMERPIPGAGSCGSSCGRRWRRGGEDGRGRRDGEVKPLRSFPSSVLRPLSPRPSARRSPGWTSAPGSPSPSG